jgi:hypothetical protein
MGNPLILLGILLIAAGIFANIAPEVKFPLLPGDIYIQKEGFTIYIPIVSSILVSIILTFIFRLFQ